MDQVQAPARMDRVYQAIVGDELRVPVGETISFSCQVENAEAGWLLRVINRAGEAACLEIDAETWMHTWEIEAAQDDYYRVEVIEPPPRTDRSGAIGAVCLCVEQPDLYSPLR